MLLFSFAATFFLYICKKITFKYYGNGRTNFDKLHQNG